MAIIYSFPYNEEILPSDILVGTSTKLYAGKPKNETKNFNISSITYYVNSFNTLDLVLERGNETLRTAKMGALGLWESNIDNGDGSYGSYGTLRLDSEDSVYSTFKVIGGGFETPVLFQTSDNGIVHFKNEHFNPTFDFSNTSDTRTYTWQDDDGVVAFLSNIPVVGDYVPYTGATGDVELGTHTIRSFNGTSGVKLTPTSILFQQDTDTGILYMPSGYGGNWALPEGTGTLALTSDITSISLTTTGSSGSSTLISNVLNVPTYTLSGLGGEPTIAAGTTSQYWRGDKTWQTFPTIPTVGTWGALNYPTWTTGTPFVKMTAAGTFALDTSTYLTSISGITAGGDLQGTYPNPVVHQIQGQSVQNGNPVDKDLLIWDNTASMWKHQQITTITGYNNTNWDTAYSSRISSLTTTGSSGPATLLSNVLNIPTYTLSGLGGQPLAINLTSLSALTYASTSFVKMTAAGTFALDTNTYLTSVGTGTTNQLTYWSGTNTLGSLTTATYPSLTEISYVKGVTSAIQTQLNSKQASLVFNPYRFLNTTQSTTTGTVTETVVATATIAAGTFNSNDIMKMFFQASKSTTISNVTMRVKIGSTSTFASATTIATYTFLLANGFVTMQRSFSLAGGNINCAAPTSTLLTDVFATSTSLTAVAANPANTLYVFFSVQLGTAGDSVNFTMAYLSN